MTHADTSTRAAWRPLGFTWLGFAVPVALVGTLLFVISDHPDDRTAGLVLLALGAAGLGAGAWVLATSSGRVRGASFALSALWLVGALAVYPTQEFTADALWVAGLPAVGALACAAVTWSIGRRPA